MFGEFILLCLLFLGAPWVWVMTSLFDMHKGGERGRRKMHPRKKGRGLKLKLLFLFNEREVSMMAAAPIIGA